MTLHTLRHTAISRMVAKGYDDYTVMAVSGHSSTRMLARYTHPTEERKADAIGSFELSRRVTTASQSPETPSDELAGIEGFAKEKWWTAGGSNSRPPRCERGALPTELAAQSTNSDYS